MSKSLGNVIDPNKVCDTRGADVLRLWVASVDTSTDVPCDDTILDHVGDAYRKIRNTFRFLLGEIEGQFDPAPTDVPSRSSRPTTADARAHVRGPRQASRRRMAATASTWSTATSTTT
jgi:isoleucyl-tRNA synthetase